MKDRCLNPRSGSYAKYGGRGITVCDRWLASFGSFLADLGPRPSLAHSLERVDTDGPYSPENCRWATRSQQQRNRRNTRLVEWAGRLVPLVSLAEEHGLSGATVAMRLRRGWSLDEALRPIDAMIAVGREDQVRIVGAPMSGPVFPRPGAFRAWLAAFPPGADCGLADDPHRCPLAAWLASLGITAEVHPEERVWTTGGRDYLLPPWAVRFGLDVDGLFEDAYGAPVPALLALSALERATDRPWLAAESTDWL